MVRILINSGVNDLGYSSMPIAMAEWVANTMGWIYPAFAASVGALGAFIAGSNTVSNMMLSISVFHGNKFRIDRFSDGCIAGSGAAAGNMIAIHNVVAASATVGMLGREGYILRKTILPTIYYVVFAGIIGLIMFYWMDITDALTIYLNTL